MSADAQRVCVWAGAAGSSVFLFAGLLVAGWLPPPSPQASAAQVVRMYSENHVRIGVGLCLLMFGAAPFGLFVAVIGSQLRRIDGAWIATVAQLGFGFLVAFGFLVPTFFFCVAAFRPHSDPQVIRAMNDAGWISLLWPISTFQGQVLAIAVAVFMDRRERPLLPRWVGYLSLWSALVPLGALLVLFFSTGPFAWNGLIAFWLVAADFSIWLLGMVVVLVRAIGEEPANSAVSHAPPWARSAASGTHVAR